MDIKDLFYVIDRMEDSELHVVVGGISGNLISSITDALEFILNLGRQVGSAIKRKRTGSKC